MADRMVALVGPGKGPRLCTKRMGRLRIRLSGFNNEAVVRVSFEGGKVERLEGCEFSIPPTPWVEVEYEGKERTFISTIYSETDAVHSP